MSEKDLTPTENPLASPRPWTEDTVVVAPAFKHHITSLTFRPLCEENWQLAKYCVNTFEEREALIREMAEGLEKLYNSIDSCIELTPELLQETKCLLTKYKSIIG